PCRSGGGGPALGPARAAPGAGGAATGPGGAAGRTSTPLGRAARCSRGAGSIPSARVDGPSGNTGAPTARTGRRATGRAERGSSCDHATPQLGEHERLDGRVGAHAVVPDLLRPAKRLDAIEVLPQALTVRADGVAVHRQLPHLPRLAVDQAQVTGELRVHLLRRQRVYEGQLEG